MKLALYILKLIYVELKNELYLFNFIEMKVVIFLAKVGMLFVKLANGVQNLLLLVKSGKKLNSSLKLLTNYKKFVLTQIYIHIIFNFKPKYRVFFLK